MSYQARAVGLAAVWDWGEVGRVGFHQQPLERDRLGDLLDLRRVLEGYDSGRGEVGSEGEGAVGHLLGLGEAVHVPPYFAGLLLPHDPQSVLGSVPGVDYQRLPTFARRPDMGPKPLPLPLEVAAETVIVQPGLADRDDLRISRQLDQARRLDGLGFVIRVHAHAREEIVVGL